MATFGERLRNSWNAFIGRDPTMIYNNVGPGNYIRPDRFRFSMHIGRNIITSGYKRIAVDVAAINIIHARVDEDGQYKETIDSSLNEALTLSANLDQTGRAMIQDAVMSLFDEGCVAIVPVDTDVNPDRTDSYKIYTLRVGKIIDWYPEHVRVELYREQTGRKETLLLEKRLVAIIENPFYAIMNEPNSTLQRLLRVLNQIDKLNEEHGANKMDLIIQLPYTLKSPARRAQAQQRRQEIEKQLTGSQLGIAYIDATEHVTQLNRSLENNLWDQAKDLTYDLFNQLGMTQKVFDGTADDAEMLNYYNRTIEPILSAITDEMTRKWLSKTARAQGQAIRFYRDQFKLVPVTEIAKIADTFTRNEIMSKNEVRSKIGMKPSDDPKADELINANLNHPEEKTTVKEEIDVNEN